MQKIYKDELKSITEKLKEKYLNVVVSVCKKMPRGVIIMGNTEILLLGNTPYIRVNQYDGTKYVALFGEEGYPNIEDMAHWADICEDYLKSYESGNSLYSQVWNIKKEVGQH